MFPTYKLSLLPPPGPRVLSLRVPPPTTPNPPTSPPATTNPPAKPPSSSLPQDTSIPIPPLFHDALAIRTAVFVHEQKCPLDEEIDADDAGSWHWVVYVEGDGKGGKEGKGEGGDDGGDKGKWLPAATIRLVPARAGHGDGGVEEEKGGEEREKEKEKEKEPSQDKAATASSTTPAPLIPQEPQMQNSALWDGKEPYARIGRLATLREYRGRGFGRVLVEEALRWAGGHGGVVERGVREGSGGGEARRGSGEGDEHGEGLVWKGLVLAHAQAGVEGWYRDLGWRTDVGMGRWDEVGIEHVGMWRRVVVGG